MEKEEIQINDWARILTGDSPPIFLVEIIIRALVLYIMLMIALRLMGKRMANRMTRNELAGIATLAAAIGMPMQTPGRGLIPAILIVTLVVIVQRFLAKRAAKNPGFEVKFLGKTSAVVKDGVLQIKELRKQLISRDRILSVLRSESIIHLGQVKRLYLEKTGSFTLVKEKEAQPGLAVLPEWDEEFIALYEKQEDRQLCNNCGLPVTPAGIPCPSCGNTATAPAIK